MKALLLAVIFIIGSTLLFIPTLMVAIFKEHFERANRDKSGNH